MPENRENSPSQPLIGIQCLGIEGLVGEHLDAVYRYAYRLTGSVQDAEDLTQQVFLLAQQRLEQLREADRARGWLFAILRNLFLKMAERAVPIAATNIGLNLDAVIAATTEEGPVDSRELQAAIDALPVDFRLVVIMYYMEDCSYREIAEKLELPIGTVMSRLARAKRQLRANLWKLEEKPARAKPVSAR